MATERTWNLILSELRPLQCSKTASPPLPLEASLLFLPQDWKAGCPLLAELQTTLASLSFLPRERRQPLLRPPAPSPDPHPGLWNLHRENLGLTGALFLCSVRSPGL